MTAEYIDGIKISDKDALKESGFSLKDVDEKLIQAFAEQIFHTGFVHADPHPGNGMPNIPSFFYCLFLIFFWNVRAPVLLYL